MSLVSSLPFDFHLLFLCWLIKNSRFMATCVCVCVCVCVVFFRFQQIEEHSFVSFLWYRRFVLLFSLSLSLSLDVVVSNHHRKRHGNDGRGQCPKNPLWLVGFWFPFGAGLEPIPTGPPWSSLGLWATSWKAKIKNVTEIDGHCEMKLIGITDWVSAFNGRRRGASVSGYEKPVGFASLAIWNRRVPGGIAPLESFFFKIRFLNCVVKWVLPSFTGLYLVLLGST